IHKLIQVILRPGCLVCLTLGNADAHADCIAAILDEFLIAFEHGLGYCVFRFATEELGEVDFQSPDGPDRCAGDCRGLIIGEHDGLLGADPATGGAALFSTVLVFYQNPLLAIPTLDTEEGENEAPPPIGAAGVGNNRSTS